MKLMLAAIGLLATSLTSTAFAGSDKLLCSTSDGLVIDGSLWNQQGNITSVRTEKGSKLSVTTTYELSNNAQILLDSDDAGIQRAIADATAALQQPAKESYRPDTLIVAPLAAPVYLVKEDLEECRDIGDHEFTQKASLVTVALRYNSKLKKSEVIVSKKELNLNCLYSYATSTGGRCHDIGN